MSDANSPGPLATAEAAPVGASAAVASVAAGSLRARAGDVADLAAAVALSAARAESGGGSVRAVSRLETNRGRLEEAQEAIASRSEKNAPDVRPRCI